MNAIERERESVRESEREEREREREERERERERKNKERKRERERERERERCMVDPQNRLKFIQTQSRRGILLVLVGREAKFHQMIRRFC